MTIRFLLRSPDVSTSGVLFLIHTHMIQGKKKKEPYTIEEIFRASSGGYNIYVKYLGNVKKGAMRRPWGNDEHPSFGIWQAPDGIWMWKDQAKEEVGGPIQFVQKLFGLGFKDAIDKILFDLGIGDKEILAARQHIQVQEKLTKTDLDYVHITARTMKFKPRHHQFWNCVGVSESWCKKFNCFAVKELAINRKKVKIGEHEIVFAYLADDIDKLKLYFPDRETYRFRTNVPFHYIWNYNNLPEQCDKLVIHKSMKDLITFAQIYPHNVATQNESTKTFDQETISKLESRSKERWLFYGSDDDAVVKVHKIVSETGWNSIATPREMLPEVNDVYSFVKTYGIQKLEDYCKQRNLL